MAISSAVLTAGQQTRSSAKVLLVVFSLVSFITGVFAGAILPSVTTAGKVPEQSDKSRVANEMTFIPSPSSGNDTVPKKIQAEEREPEAVYVTATLSDLLQNVIKMDEADTLAAILDSFPSGSRLSGEDSKAIIILCSRLLERPNSNNYLESVSRIAGSIDGPTAKLFDPDVISKTLGPIDDLRRKLKEKSGALTSDDRALYEAIQEATGEKQLVAAKEYLKQAPRKTMNSVVTQWLTWAESPIIATVDMKNLSRKGPFTIRFSANGHEIGKAVDSQKDGPILSPLDIDLTALEITPQKRPSMVGITARFDQNVGLSTDFDGELEISVQSTGSTPVALKGRTIRNQRLELSIQVKQIDSAPELPAWQLERTP